MRKISETSLHGLRVGEVWVPGPLGAHFNLAHPIHSPEIGAHLTKWPMQ